MWDVLLNSKVFREEKVVEAIKLNLFDLHLPSALKLSLLLFSPLLLPFLFFVFTNNSGSYNGNS